VAHIYWEHRELLDDPGLRRVLEGEGSPGTAGDCTPPMDVVETSSAVEVLMDLPGVPRSHLTVVFSQGTLVVAGRKVPASCAHREAAFHLAERGFAVAALSGELSQRERNVAMQALRDGRARVCVATDVAARGLDLEDIAHVINFDPPEDDKGYVHRVGRTGRAGRSGRGSTLVLPDQQADVSRVAARLGHKEQFERTGMRSARPKLVYTSRRGRRSRW